MLADIETVGVIGLSMGGAGAIEATGNNPEIDTVVGLAPGYLTEIPIPFMKNLHLSFIDNLIEYMMADLVDATQQVEVPAQIQIGSNDGFASPEALHELYSDILPVTTTKEFIEITGGSHAAFIDLWVAYIGNMIELLLGGGNTCGFQTQHDISSKYFTSWFQYYLKDISEYETYIFGDEAQQDIDDGIISAFEYNA